MAAESIGNLIPTKIPGYADAADIQAALRVYHYGSYDYDSANTDPNNLVSPSLAKTFYDLQQDIVNLENRPASGGAVDINVPISGDFIPPGVPNGYIWVDEDGVVGGAPMSATAVFTTTPPTADLTSGLLWVDKDPTGISANPFVTLIGTQTLTNKTLTAPILTSPTITSPVLTLGTTSSTLDARISWDTTSKKILVGNGSISLDFVSATLITNAQLGTSYTLVLSDKDKLVEASNASSITLTVPTNAAVPYPVGTQINLLQTNTGQVTVAAASGVTVNATPGLKLRTQWSSATLIKRASDTWVLVGDLSA